MHNSAKKIIDIYTNLNELSEEKISEILHFIEQSKTENNKAKSKQIGQLAGLCTVKIPKNLEDEIRTARKNITKSMTSKKI